MRKNYDPDPEFDVRDGDNAFVYTFDGEALIGGQDVPADHLAVLHDGAQVTARAGARPGRFLLLSAKRLEEPIVHYGPFVMNTTEEIQQAIADFQAGRF